jgi:integrase
MFPKHHRRLPTVLSQDEVAQLIDSASHLMHRGMLMTIYATGIRRAELCRLKVADIDSERNGPARPAGQGRPRPGCSVEPQAAGDFAGVLALDEAADLSVARHGEQPASGCARHR